jgi:nucleoside-diphosphate-sugar epimerase
MAGKILITGAEGLVGAALARALAERGDEVVGLDLRAAEPGDVRKAEDVRRALAGCEGVVHLAAVSRVVWGERDPEACLSTNVGGTRTVLREARRAWVLFASSREVYGQPAALPATEDAPLAPVNVYGRCKVAGERLADEAERAAVVRLSNVYGSTADHADRVLPAFARAAVAGDPLRVDGAGHTFDFTHLDDAVRGLMAVADLLRAGERPPPIHLVTGAPTTLGEAARLAVELAGTDAPIVEAPPRDYDVARFVGDPGRARALLGWTPRVPFREGLARLVADFRALATRRDSE